MLAASATTALPQPRRTGDEIRRRTRRTVGQTAEPILQCRAHHLHKLFRRGRIDAERILHPDQQAADGLLIRAEPPGKGRHALHELRDDERRQQRQRTEKQRIADGHRPAAPAAKELLRKKARGYVQYIGQQQPPAKRCQQPEKRPARPAGTPGQPVCRQTNTAAAPPPAAASPSSCGVCGQNNFSLSLLLFCGTLFTAHTLFILLASVIPLFFKR